MKRILLVIGILIGVLLLAVAALPFLIDANRFRPLLESELTRGLGRAVKLGDLKLSLLSGGVTASDLSIADDPKFNRDSFLSAKALTITVDLGPLIFSRKLNVKGITIDQPNIVLLQAPSGLWNFSSLGPSAEARNRSVPARGTQSVESGLDLTVNLLKITNGRIVLGKTERKVKPEVFDKVNVEVQDFSATSVFPFSLAATATGGANLKLQGKAGPINSADSAATPLEAALTVTHLDLARSGFLPATGFAGLVSINGNFASTGQKVQLKGNVNAEQLVLARGGSPAKKPVAFDFDLEHDSQKHAGALRRGQVHFGAATASLTGSYRMEGESVLLNMKFAGPDMAIPELEAMLPALDIVLPAGSSLQGGTAAANFTVVGPTDRLVTDGSIGVKNTRLAGFDLGKNMTLVTTLAGLKNGPNTEIQSFGSSVHIDPTGVRSENIQLIAPEIGELNGAGTVSATHALDFKMTAKLHGGGVLAVMGSNTTVPFKIVGTSSNPKFQPDIKGMAVDKLKSLTEGGAAGKAAGDILKGFFGGGKKN
jgi:AsmA protein